MTIIILAAGLSSRMGENKLLLPYNGKTIIQSSVEAALSFSDDVIVVTGHEKERIQEVLSTFRVKVVYCPDYMKGQKTSTLCGIEAAPDSDFAIVPGDLPLITAEDYEGVCSALSTHTIARAIHASIPGHPVMFRKEHRMTIPAFPGSLREYLMMFDIGTYNGSIGTVLDADTPSRYKAIISGNRDLSVLR